MVAAPGSSSPSGSDALPRSTKRCTLRCGGHFFRVAVQRLNREGEFRIPEEIKGPARLGSHVTEGNRIHVLKVKARVLAKVFIAYVAATQHRGHAVDQKDLVVHAVVKGGFFKGVVQLLGRTAVTHGIEEPYFYIRVGIQRLVGAVAARVVDIIEQYPHPHAAVGCLQHLVGERQAAVIGLPEVVLNIEGGGGERGHVEPALERLAGVSQQPDTRVRFGGRERHQRRGCRGGVIELAS